MEHLTSHFQEYLILLLLGALFFKESLTSFINSKLGIKEKAPKWGEAATAEISRLAEYANHNTTEKLDAILAVQKEIVRTLEEIKEYGVRIRE